MAAISDYIYIRVFNGDYFVIVLSTICNVGLIVGTLYLISATKIQRWEDSIGAHAAR